MEMRRIGLLFALVGLFVGAMAAPAVADRGAQFTETIVFDDVDPCTGDAHTVTLVLSIVEHTHGAITVANWTGAATTTLGYVGSGSGKYVANDNMGLHRERASWINTHPETGDAFTVDLSWVTPFDEPPMIDMTLTCLTA